MSDEGDDEGRKKKIAIIVIAVILLLLIIIGIILCLYFFVLEGDDDDDKEGSTDDSLGGERKLGGLDLETEEHRECGVTWKKMNFTNANAECLASPSKLPLMYGRNKTDEDELMQMFIDKYKAQPDGDEKKNCGNEFFVGVRKMVQSEIRSAIREYFPGPIMAGFGAYVSDYKKGADNCYGLKTAENFKIGLVNCGDEASFKCYLCQYECADNKPLCYKIYSNNAFKRYSEPNNSCIKDAKGLLATVEHESMLTNIRKQVKDQKDACSDPLIGNQFSSKYETSTGREISYAPSRIHYTRDKNRIMSCLVINVEKDFRWEYQSCTEDRCFSCFV